jgi:DNA topoisomerase IA
LYDLIWKRTVACQMIPRHPRTPLAVDLNCGDGNVLRATGSTIADPGFMAVYQEDVWTTATDEGDEALLPPMQEGDMGGFAAQDASRTALHRTAAALHRGEPGQDPGRIRHRPPLDLCERSSRRCSRANT